MTSSAAQKLEIVLGDDTLVQREILMGPAANMDLKSAFAKGMFEQVPLALLGDPISWKLITSGEWNSARDILRGEGLAVLIWVETYFAEPVEVAEEDPFPRR